MFAKYLGPKKLVENGKLSFPSGHAASSFASGTFAFLQLRSALPEFYHPLLLLLSIIFPIVCSGSRYVEGCHHLHDICIGAVIGILLGYYTFKSMISGFKSRKRTDSISDIDEMDTNESLY